MDLISLAVGAVAGAVGGGAFVFITKGRGGRVDKVNKRLNELEAKLEKKKLT
jgi:hypothetical protein